MDSSAQKKQACALLQQGKALESRDVLNAVCAHSPADGEALYLLANTLLHLGEFAEAAACCHRALSLTKNVAAIHFCLAMAQGSMGQLESAKFSLENALRIDPMHIESRIRLGAVYQALGQHQEALKHYKTAAKSQPSNVEVLIRLGDIYLALGKIEQAKSVYRKALKRHPGEPNATAGLAAIAARSNDPRSAYELIRPLLAQGNTNVSLGTLFADISAPLDKRREAIAHLQQLLSIAAQPVDERRRLLFALGKLYDGLAEYQTAFDHYQRGNALSAESFDPWSADAFLTGYINFWNPDFLAAAPRARKQQKGQQLVFIVGMPRSGTSLVEQIIGSHPAVHAAGELQEVNDFSGRLQSLTESSESYPYCLNKVSQPLLDAFAKSYLKTANKQAGGGKAAVITDKMPSNFWHLGLVQLLFPKAKIIHCVRDPRDTCLSCYFQNFAGQHPYSYDLSHLGIYYRQYEKLMRHWNHVLTLPILEVRYEDLVADSEPVSRQLIEYCGLEWDARVLRFYDTKRTVVTSSFDQVTKPVYRQSMARWKNYDAFLDPLYKGLEHVI